MAYQGNSAVSFGNELQELFGVKAIAGNYRLRVNEKWDRRGGNIPDEKIWRAGRKIEDGGSKIENRNRSSILDLRSSILVRARQANHEWGWSFFGGGALCCGIGGWWPAGGPLGGGPPGPLGEGPPGPVGGWGAPTPGGGVLVPLPPMGAVLLLGILLLIVFAGGGADLPGRGGTFRLAVRGLAICSRLRGISVFCRCCTAAS